MPRLLTRSPRPAALLAAGLATTVLGLTATFFGGPGADASGADRGDETVTVYNDGRSDAVGDDHRDGRIDEDESGWDCRTMGNRACGTRVVPDECKGAGNAVALCVTVASRPAYGWTNPSGSRVDNPDGHAEVRDLEEQPGTPEFTAALRALDAEWREHH